MPIHVHGICSTDATLFQTRLKWQILGGKIISRGSKVLISANFRVRRHKVVLSLRQFAPQDEQRFLKAIQHGCLPPQVRRHHTKQRFRVIAANVDVDGRIFVIRIVLLGCIASAAY